MFRWIVLWITALFLYVPAYAQQVQGAEIGINGLTCSQCSRSVELSLRKLGFIKDVHMDLEHTEAQLYFKENELVDPAAIAGAVKNAGFSVRYLNMIFLFSKPVLKGICFTYGGNAYQLVQSPENIEGRVTLQVLGEGYLPKKEYRKWQPLLKNSCGNNRRAYFVTPKAGRS